MSPTSYPAVGPIRIKVRVFVRVRVGSMTGVRVRVEPSRMGLILQVSASLYGFKGLGLSCSRTLA